MLNIVISLLFKKSRSSEDTSILTVLMSNKSWELCLFEQINGGAEKDM